YRILKEADLVCPWGRRRKRRREQDEKATRPDQRWSTDLMHVQVGEGVYYFISFLDEYSRYLVHWELVASMDGLTVSWAAQEVLGRVVRRYNTERLHSALGYLPPQTLYRGDAEARRSQRRQKLAQARHERRERNLELRQRTLPFTEGEPVL